MNAYPDADFAGMYGHEKPTDPVCAKSRSGFVIVFAGVQVLWQSKLQTQTALSTMEAEVIALGACMKELIPIMDMVQSLAVTVGIPAGDVKMRVSVYEDNSGALVLAETLPPQFTPHSKYYTTKTIWFSEEINEQTKADFMRKLYGADCHARKTEPYSPWQQATEGCHQKWFYAPYCIV